MSVVYTRSTCVVGKNNAKSMFVVLRSDTHAVEYLYRAADLVFSAHVIIRLNQGPSRCSYRGPVGNQSKVGIMDKSMVSWVME